MIHGRLDYCNSVLYGTSSANLNKSERVQNSAARIVTRTRRSDQATSIIADLHWLPVKYRTQYKVAVTDYKILTTQEPSYQTDVIRFHAPSRHLRPCNRNLSETLAPLYLRTLWRYTNAVIIIIIIITEGPHQPRLHCSLVLSVRTYSLEQSTTACGLRAFQPNVIQVTAINRTGHTTAEP